MLFTEWLFMFADPRICAGCVECQWLKYCENHKFVIRASRDPDWPSGAAQFVTFYNHLRRRSNKRQHDERWHRKTLVKLWFRFASGIKPGEFLEQEMEERLSNEQFKQSLIQIWIQQKEMNNRYEHLERSFSLLLHNLALYSSSIFYITLRNNWLWSLEVMDEIVTQWHARSHSSISIRLLPESPFAGFAFGDDNNVILCLSSIGAFPFLSKEESASMTRLRSRSDYRKTLPSRLS